MTTSTKPAPRRKAQRAPMPAPVPSNPPKGSKGFTSIIAAATAILGVLTAIWPDAPVLCALIDAVPEFEVAIPLILTSAGAIVAAATKPPMAG